ncbi:MAG TPA: DoxX family protein [Isosphaeraceae bacterium]|jgi:hypothetical protein
MQSTTQAAPGSKAMLWAGWIITALVAAFLLLDGVMKLVKPEPVVEATVRLGYSESVIPVLGVVVLVCLAFYLVPRTSVLGAILLTGYLGGAVASHLRHDDGPFPVVFPAIFGALAWLGIWLRDPQLRALIPVRR